MTKDIHTKLDTLLAFVTKELVSEIIIVGETAPEAKFLSEDLAELNLFEQICFDLQQDGLTPPVSDFINSIIADKALKLEEEQLAIFKDELISMEHHEQEVIRNYFYSYSCNYSSERLDYFLEEFSYLERDSFN